MDAGLKLGDTLVKRENPRSQLRLSVVWPYVERDC
jgi:hypothetical protein